MREYLADWKLWVVLASFIKDFVLVLGIILVKFNDLKHVGKSLQKIEKSTDTLVADVSEIKGRCAERGDRISALENKKSSRRRR